jgi:hypothetical protein
VRVEKACGYLSLDSIWIMIMRNGKVAIRFSIKGSRIYSMNFFEIFFCLCDAQKDKKHQNKILKSKGGKKGRMRGKRACGKGSFRGGRIQSFLST